MTNYFSLYIFVGGDNTVHKLVRMAARHLVLQCPKGTCRFAAPSRICRYRNISQQPYLLINWLHE